MSNEPDNKRTVQAGRRRKTDSTAGSRERAEAPERERESSTGGAKPSRPARQLIPGRPVGGSGLPRNPLLMVALLVILLVCGLPIYLLMGSGGDESGDLPVPAEVFSEETVTESPEEPKSVLPSPTADLAGGLSGAGAGSQGDSWLVLLYQDADDKVLEQDIYIDLNEAERAGSGEGLDIVAQLDRYQSGYQGDGDWTTARRYYVTRDADLNRLRSQQLADLGEANMADAATLVDFAVWAIETYPADKVALILSDHGLGWPGGWSDPTARDSGESNFPLARAIGDHLYLMEIENALQEIRQRTGLEQFELVGMDACLMGHLEVFTALAPHARYAVASQETEPALGWAYASFLEDLRRNPSMDGAELSRLIVESYIDEDERIQDEEALSAFARGATSSQVINQLNRDITLTSFDLSGLAELVQRLNNFAFALQSTDPRAISQARSYAQSFTSIFGKGVPAAYIDLGHFARVVAQEAGGAISAPAEQLVAAIDQAVVAERHGKNKPGASGVSIYFPNSTLYNSPTTGAQSYTAAAESFAQDSLWDDFLAYHYLDRSFTLRTEEIAIPERSDTVVAPATGGIQVSELELSEDSIAIGESTEMSVAIQGENIGHIKLLVGYYDQDDRSINLIDTDFLESELTRELNGVYYPDWGEGPFRLQFEWQPVVYAISDGEQNAVALFSPETYGATAADAVYTVDGIYTYADGETRRALLYFRDGELFQVMGFSEADGGAPRQILPQAGDTFTILEQWLDLDVQGGVEAQVTEPGETLTFGEQPFRWVDLDAAAGDYILGFLVEDLDGKVTPVYDPIQVE